jgi:hypothetical protein
MEILKFVACRWVEFWNSSMISFFAKEKKSTHRNAKWAQELCNLIPLLWKFTEFKINRALHTEWDTESANAVWDSIVSAVPLNVNLDLTFKGFMN